MMDSVTVKDIMTTRVVTVEMDDSIGLILEIFKHAGFHHVLVVSPETGAFVGIISDRDVYRNVSCFIGTLSEQARDQNTLRKKAHHIMTRNLITATEDMTVKQAAELMLANKISCLPVLCADRTIRGIVTWKDLLRYAFDLPKHKPTPQDFSRKQGSEKIKEGKSQAIVPSTKTNNNL